MDDPAPLKESIGWCICRKNKRQAFRNVFEKHEAQKNDIETAFVKSTLFF